jgi:N6-adenosine-specific RNA methylase IME4
MIKRVENQCSDQKVAVAPYPSEERAMDDLPIRYDAARRALAEAHRVDEVKDIRDKATAMRVYAKQAKDRQLIEHATEIRLRAERRGGELLAEMAKNKGAVPGKTGRKGRPVLDPTPKLKDLGVSKSESSLWQKLARIPEEQVEKLIAEAKQKATTSIDQAVRVVTKKARRAQREADHGARIAAVPDQKFGVIYADPLWRSEPYSRENGLDRAADNPCAAMDLDAITTLQVPAANDAVLFLWATAPMLPQALEVMAAWGFEYKSNIVWIKNQTDTGYWFDNKHELLLVAARGRNIPAAVSSDQYKSVIEAPIGEHFAKPAIFRAMIETLFPNIPKIELFARGGSIDGWTRWGNEVTEPAPADEQPANVRVAAKAPAEMPAASLAANDPGEMPDFLRRKPVQP